LVLVLAHNSRWTLAPFVTKLSSDRFDNFFVLLVSDFGISDRYFALTD